MTRGELTTTWGRDTLGRLGGISHAITPGVNLSYSYPERDERHRIKERQPSIGRSWTDLAYDDADQLTGINAGGRTLAYGYDGQGNRNAQGTVASHVVHPPDQIRSRTLTSRGFGVYGAVNPLAQLTVTHALAPSGQSLPVNSQTGEFYGWWEVQGTGSEQVDVLVRGSLSSAGGQGGNAVAEKEMRLLVPPVQENFTFDSAGRTKTDAFWTYTWDNPGRLKRMDRNPARLREPGSTAEVVEYDYDSDGRRTQKTRTVTYQDRVQVERSRVLWAGWLPILEERSRDGRILYKRWFQWGADLSGTLDGAGGIGGLVAIIEEKPGEPSRTLLPVQDGLGNVTAVLDSASGNVIARYDFGPYGEPLGEYGETDVCPFRWQTKWFDEESEHYYFGYRYYSPRLGRWLSRDPLGEAGGFNLYAYCGNDPVNRHDPTGMQGISFTLPDTLGLVSRLGQFVNGWINEGDQLDIREQAYRDFALRNPGITRDSSRFGRTRRTLQMQQEFFQNRVLEVDGLRPEGTADAVLFAREEELWLAKSYNDSVLGVNLRRQERFEQVAGVALTVTPFVAGRLSSMPRLNPRNYDWRPFFAPYRGGYTYTGVPVPGLPTYRGPTPRVNIGHVFHGEINARGRAVGFHHEGSIGHSGTARISQIIDPPNALGVYRARVEIFDPSSGTWVVKNAPSTFFPTAWSRSQVLTEIRDAFGSGGIIRNNYWEGISPSGVRIGGYLDATGNINTAFPIY